MKQIQPLIQSVKTTQMKNSGRGIEVALRFPLEGNSELALLLMEQQGNPIGVMFSDPIQARLPAAPRDAAEAPAAETEDVETEVDGQPAKIRRPRSNAARNGNGATAYPFHAFVESEQHPGLCKVCNYRPEHSVHAEEADRPIPHPFVPRGSDNHCGTCSLAEDHPLHVLPVEEPQQSSTGNDLADKLIEDAKDAPVEA